MISNIKIGQSMVVQGKYMLPEWLIMLDAEMTGVVPERDSLLQVAALRLHLDNGQYEESGSPLVAHFAYGGKPETEFHKKYLSHIFSRCNRSKLTPSLFKDNFHKWLGDLKGNVMPVGDCVPCDMQFLYQKGCIDRGDISKRGEQLPGTFHYEYFELNPLKEFARCKIGHKFEVPGIDTANIHDAYVDCKNQLIELNYFIKVLIGDYTPIIG